MVMDWPMVSWSRFLIEMSLASTFQIVRASIPRRRLLSRLRQLRLLGEQHSQGSEANRSVPQNHPAFLKSGGTVLDLILSGALLSKRFSGVA